MRVRLPARYALAAALAVGGFASSPRVLGQQGAPVEVEAAVVRAETVRREVSAVGTLLANESVIIRPEVEGRVADLSFREGQAVTEGTVLVRIEDAIHQARLVQAEAALTLSRANYERAADLYTKGSGTARARDETFAKMRSDEADLALNRALLAKTVIRAPFDGILGLRKVSVGAFVRPGDDVVDLVDIDPIKVDFRIPETLAAGLRVGQDIRVAVDALPGRAFEGRVYAISPEFDPQGRSVLLRARIANPNGPLRPGMFARVGLVLEEREGALVVPETALVPLAGEQFVFKVVDGKAVQAMVKIGQRRAGRVEVREGLKAGETVVTAGQIKLRDGVPVRPLPPSAGG
ncbi:MAG: efflux RND transporter periplasmic adaptor subunit [Proteobacteria bacterium]|nr:efflux RND transporter periplasmic adaptor subunit [Pseudomonadota bacterium]